MEKSSEYAHRAAIMYIPALVSACVLILISFIPDAKALEGPFAGVDVGVSEPLNANYRGHVKTGGTVNPFVGYDYNRYLGVQGQLHVTLQSPDGGPPNDNQQDTTTLLGVTIGPRLSIPLYSFLDVYGTVQGGGFTGVSGFVDHTAGGFSLGGGINANLAYGLAVGIFARWNHAFMSASPDLGPTQAQNERGHDDIEWATIGLGVQLNFPPPIPAPLAPPHPVSVAEVPPPRKPIVFQPVYFKSDETRVPPDAAAVLNEAVRILKEEGGIHVIVEGYASASGSVETNRTISQQRARNVCRYLTEHGIAADRLTCEGFGSDRPEVPGDTPEADRKNRRVELHVR